MAIRPPGSEVGTTYTLRVAMNMPTDIMAKPIDGETAIGIGAFGSGAFGIAQSNQRRILRSDADR